VCTPDPTLFAPGECEEGDWPFLAGKTVLLTGATRGLGEGIVRQLCTTEHKPARVVLLARSETKSKVRRMSAPNVGSPSTTWRAHHHQERAGASQDVPATISKHNTSFTVSSGGGFGPTAQLPTAQGRELSQAM